MTTRSHRFEARYQDMTFTEQGAFFDGIDDPTRREAGTNLLVDALGAALDEMP